MFLVDARSLRWRRCAIAPCGMIRYRSITKLSPQEGRFSHRMFKEFAISRVESAEKAAR